MGEGIIWYMIVIGIVLLYIGFVLTVIFAPIICLLVISCIYTLTPMMYIIALIVQLMWLLMLK